MRFFTFSLFVIAVIFTLSCSAENPICTTNFCAVGEVFPRSELEDGQAFSEVDIDDSVIFATLAGGTTPVKTTPPTLPPGVESVELSTIVGDVAAGNTSYISARTPKKMLHFPSNCFFQQRISTEKHTRNPRPYCVLNRKPAHKCQFKNVIKT